MEKIDVIEQAANRLLQHNVAEARIAIETGLFIKLVETDKELLNDSYIKRWYRLSVAVDRE